MLNAIPLGARYMLLSALAFACMGVCVKFAGESGIPVMEIIAARAVVSLVISYVDVKRKGLPLFGTHRLLLFARGLVGFVSLACVFYALVHLPFAEASVLQYLHPVFTALLALIFLGERPTRATLLCIVLSFAGLMVMVQPDFLFGGASVSYDGLAYTLVRKLSRLEDPSVIVMYFPMVCLPAAILFYGHEFVMPSGWTWLALLFVGIFTQVGQVTLTKSMQLETASRATSFSYSQVVFAAILGVIVFGEVPGVWTLFGAAMIMLGALVNILWKPRKANPQYK
jgi:drug/metabolite transporter (DMT)-like permease